MQQEPDKRITDITWMCEKMKDSINTAGKGEKVSLLVKAINFREGETVMITVDETKGKDIKTDTKGVTYSGEVNADGTAELKEEVKIQTF